MYRKSVAIALIAYLIGFIQTRGQAIPDGITLGTVRLALGMPKDVALSALAKSYELQNLGEGQASSSWLVRTGKDSAAEPIGSVAFKDGKLTTVMKYWTPKDQQRGFEFATNLYGVITSFTNEGKNLCTIETARKQDTGIDSKAIFISCGAKYVRIDITSGAKTGDTTGLAEVLETK
jgi:hypothetical protein